MDAASFEKLWARWLGNGWGRPRKWVENEEDVAAEVFQKLYFASVNGKLPELTDRQSLWRLHRPAQRRGIRGEGRATALSDSPLTLAPLMDRP